MPVRNSYRHGITVVKKPPEGRRVGSPQANQPKNDTIAVTTEPPWNCTVTWSY